MNALPSILQFRRAAIEEWIEQLIAILDEIDGDENFEDGGDSEPSIGSPPQCIGDKIEDDLEHDTADQEYSLGWSNPRCGDQATPEGWGPDGDEDGFLGGFHGDGQHLGSNLLRQHIKDKPALAKALNSIAS